MTVGMTDAAKDLDWELTEAEVEAKRAAGKLGGDLDHRARRRARAQWG